MKSTILSGEATFHQVHGGVATNGTLDANRTFFDEYAEIRGREYQATQVEFSLLGTVNYEFHPCEGLVTKTNPKIVKNWDFISPVAKLIGGKLPPSSKRKLRVGYDLAKAVLRPNPLQGIR